jgi:hypothetical protein
MAHRLSPEAEAELDGIWYYIATESGSMDVADRFIDSLTRRFYGAAMKIYGLACAVLPSASTLSFTESTGKTC